MVFRALIPYGLGFWLAVCCVGCGGADETEGESEDSVPELEVSEGEPADADDILNSFGAGNGSNGTGSADASHNQGLKHPDSVEDDNENSLNQPELRDPTKQ